MGQNWLRHLSAVDLFLAGDGNPQHSASGHGAFYIVDFYMLIIGIYCLFKSKKYRPILVLVLWAMLMPFSSALASEGVNFVRYLPFFIPLTIFIAAGISFINKSSHIIIIFIIYLFLVANFLDAYFVHTKAKNGAWQNGYKQLVDYISPIQDSFETIYIQKNPDQPYIFFLFYQKYSPSILHRVNISLRKVFLVKTWAQ